MVYPAYALLLDSSPLCKSWAERCLKFLTSFITSCPSEQISRRQRRRLQVIFLSSSRERRREGEREKREGERARTLPPFVLPLPSSLPPFSQSSHSVSPSSCLSLLRGTISEGPAGLKELSQPSLLLSSCCCCVVVVVLLLLLLLFCFVDLYACSVPYAPYLFASEIGIPASIMPSIIFLSFSDQLPLDPNKQSFTLLPATVVTAAESIFTCHKHAGSLSTLYVDLVSACIASLFAAGIITASEVQLLSDFLLLHLSIRFLRISYIRL